MFMFLCVVVLSRFGLWVWNLILCVMLLWMMVMWVCGVLFGLILCGIGWFVSVLGVLKCLMWMCLVDMFVLCSVVLVWLFILKGL